MLDQSLVSMTAPYLMAGKILLENLGMCWSDNNDERKASAGGAGR